MSRARRSAVAVLAGAMLVPLALAACGGSGSGGDSPKVLKLWHYEGPKSAMGVAWAAAIQEFEAKHPGVKVQFEEKSFDQIQKTAPMVLNSKDAPDLLEYNKGNATAGLLSKQGLLTDLTPEVTKRGWDKLVTGGLATTARYSPDGVMGSGKWFGVPNYGEYLMVYFNKDIFAKYGIAVPKTFDELTAAMDTLVKNGVTPFANAGAEYLAQQYLYQLALSKADRSWVNSYELYQGKVDFHDEAWTYAADTFADWVKKGYIAKTSVSLKADNAGTDFLQQKTAMIFSGTWWAGRFEQEATFGWDTFPWPGATLTPGSSGNLWVVPTSAKAKDLALDFIDITMSKENQNLLGNSGGIPVAADPSAITDPKAQQLIANFDALTKADGLAFYPDWPVPGFYDVLQQQTQKLMTGGDPSGVLDELQKAYDAGAPKS